MIEYTWIYALVDPRTNEIRYIGKADNPRKRLRHHLNSKELRRNIYKNNWIKELLALGLKPIMKPFARVPKSQWQEAEITLIAAAKKRNWPLTNVTAGGDGLTDFSFSFESRYKMGASNRGKKLSLEIKEKMSKASRIVDKSHTTSKYRGVYWHKISKKWCARIKINNKTAYLGLYLTEDEAYEARLQAEVI